VRSPSIAGVRRSRHAPVLWVACGEWDVRAGDPLLVELAGERVLGEVIIPNDLLLLAGPITPVGRIVAAGEASPDVGSALRERDDLALAQAHDCASPLDTFLGASWSLDVGTLTVRLAGPPADEAELRRRLGERFRASIRLDWPVAAGSAR
jgi:hypothetical protein